jgi:hypothetical protein
MRKRNSNKIKHYRRSAKCGTRDTVVRQNALWYVYAQPEDAQSSLLFPSVNMVRIVMNIVSLPVRGSA